MKQQSVGKGFSILALASLLVKVLSLLYIPFLLAIIGEEGNGIYAAAYQVFVFIYVLTNSGTPVAISKLVSELVAVKNYKDAVRSFKIARFLLLVLGLAMSLLMLALAKPISRVLHFDRSFLAIAALSPTVLITSVASAYRGYFQGRGNMTPTAVSQVIEQIINTIFTLVFAALFLSYGLEAACAGGTIGTSLGALFSLLTLVLFYRKNRRFKVPEEDRHITVERHTYKFLVKKIVGYGVPITLCVGMQYAGNLVDLWNTKSRLLIAGFSESEATTLYSFLFKYTQLMNVPISLIVALATTMLPAISGLLALKDKKQLQSKIIYSFRLCFFVSIPSAFGMAILSKPIYSLLHYKDGYDLMLFGSIVLVLISIVQIQTTILQGSNKLYLVTFNLLIGIVCKIVANYFLISIYDINVKGAIIGSIIGYSIPILLNQLAIKKHLKIKINLIQHAVAPVMASIVMGAVVYLLYFRFGSLYNLVNTGYLINALVTVIAVIFGGITYFYCLFIVGGIRSEDLETLPQRFIKFLPERMLRKIKENN